MCMGEGGYRDWSVYIIWLHPEQSSHENQIEASGVFLARIKQSHLNYILLVK